MSCEASIDYLSQLDVDVIAFEGKENECADFELMGKRVSKNKKVAIGVVSHRTLQIEQPDEAAELVRKALQFIEPERLILSTERGFGRQGMSRMYAFFKMVSITRGANIVRKELGLEEAPVLATDPAYAMLPAG